MFAENGVPSRFYRERIGSRIRGLKEMRSVFIINLHYRLKNDVPPHLSRRSKFARRIEKKSESASFFDVSYNSVTRYRVRKRAREYHVPLHRSIDHSADQSPSLTVSIRSSPSLFPSCNGSPLESCIMFQFGSCIIDSSWRGLAHSLTPRVFRPRVRFRPPCHFGINHPRSALVKSTRHRVDIASRFSTKYNKYVKVEND